MILTAGWDLLVPSRIGTLDKAAASSGVLTYRDWLGSGRWMFACSEQPVMQSADGSQCIPRSAVQCQSATA